MSKNREEFLLFAGSFTDRGLGHIQNILAFGKYTGETDT